MDSQGPSTGPSCTPVPGINKEAYRQKAEAEQKAWFDKSYGACSPEMTPQTVVDIRNRRDSLRSRIGTLQQKLDIVQDLLNVFEN